MPDSFGNPLPEDLTTSQNLFTNQFTAGSLDSGAPFNTGVNQDFLNQDVSALTTPTTTTGEGDFFSNLFSNSQGGQGTLAPTLGAISGAAQTFLGFQQLSEGKKQNRINQSQWQAQFDIQKQEYDRRTAERAARVNANRASVSAGG